MLHWTACAGPPTVTAVIHAGVAVAHELYCFSWEERYSRGGSPVHRSVLDVHVFNTVSLCWGRKTCAERGGGGEPRALTLSVPWGHTAVLVGDGTIYIWGGWPFGDVLYAFDVGAHAWSTPRVSGRAVPPVTMYHSACVVGRLMYVHGGYPQRTGVCTDALFALDTATMVWSLVEGRGTRPPASSGHSATIVGTKMFVFGGSGTQYEYYSGVRVFDTETETWLNMPSSAQHRPEAADAHRRVFAAERHHSPEEREHHLAFAYNGGLYIYGGRSDTCIIRSRHLWKCHLETFSWKRVTPKRQFQVPTFDGRRSGCMVGERVVLVGDHVYVLDLSPSLKTLCKLAVIQYGLEQSELPYDIRWELAAMTAADSRTRGRRWSKCTVT